MDWRETGHLILAARTFSHARNLRKGVARAMIFLETTHSVIRKRDQLCWEKANMLGMATEVYPTFFSG